MSGEYRVVRYGLVESGWPIKRKNAITARTIVRKEKNTTAYHCRPTRQRRTLPKNSRNPFLPLIRAVRTMAAIAGPQPEPRNKSVAGRESASHLTGRTSD